MSPNVNVLALPLELLIHIFALLDGRQIARCTIVCSHFKHVIENSTTLQYFIKLDMFGYTDGPRRADAVHLHELERHIDAWNKLDWIESRIDMPIWHYGLDALRDGIYAFPNSTEVICIQLPSLSRGVPLRTWTLKFEFPVDQVEIHPSNNLLDAWEPDRSTLYPLHLRTLSDNAPHPSATSPVLFPAFTITQDSEYIVRVLGPLLGILSFESTGKLEIWNWTTCQKITMLGSTIVDGLWGAFRSFEFLSTTSFLVPFDERLEVYEVPVESPGAPPYPYCLVFLDLQFQVPLSSFCYPAVHPNPLMIPWDAWSKDVYSLKENGPGLPCEMSGGRLIRVISLSDSDCIVSLSDLNRSRAGVPDLATPDLSIDDDLILHVLESDIFTLGELRMERPGPIPVAARFLSLGGGYLVNCIFCDEEHIIIWAFKPQPAGRAPEYKSDRLIILSF
ncbi:hypothetical protein BS47DRAFT_1487518 [Hydnum rufescens UP504]|uniref:F-box domain-containing protein n=1 Tax=Hydnum rufescens UP504 TaxID=1448309 RepID=A0A9P6DTA6_9AGAM|nr:hypothetical protein BS47DRAFT_1487518 [Hydnum rufescens UP504]